MGPIAFSSGSRPSFITGGTVKIVFLDIDGVLATNRSYRVGSAGTLGAFDKAAVANLNSLIQLTGAGVVISSAWRTDPSLNMGRVLRTGGVRCDIVGRTPVLGGRGFEIAAWLAGQPTGIERFAILDDTQDPILCRRFAKHFVHTNMESGFNRKALHRALIILGKRKVPSVDMKPSRKDVTLIRRTI